MGYMRITREDLTRECLRELRLWPGCETVKGVAVLMGRPRGKFTVHVAEYGSAKKNADRAIGCIQREKLRHFYLKVEI